MPIIGPISPAKTTRLTRTELEELEARGIDPFRPYPFIQAQTLSQEDGDILFGAGRSFGGIRAYEVRPNGGLKLLEDTRDTGISVFRKDDFVLGETKSGPVFASASVYGSGIHSYSFDPGGSPAMEERTTLFDTTRGGTIDGIGAVNDVEIASVGGRSFLIGTGGLNVFRLANDGRIIGRTDLVVDTEDLQIDFAYEITTIEVGKKVFVAAFSARQEGFSVFQLGKRGKLSETDSVVETPRGGFDQFESASLTVGGRTYLVFKKVEPGNFFRLYPVNEDGTLGFVDSARGDLGIGFGTISALNTVQIDGIDLLLATDETGMQALLTINADGDLTVVGSLTPTSDSPFHQGVGTVASAGGATYVYGFGRTYESLYDDEDEIFAHAYEIGGGNDRLSGTVADDILLGLAGNDILRAGAGDDLAKGGAGRDRADGGAGDDTLIGGAGNDRLSGGGQDDLLQGESGRDRLVGGPGDDVLEGGPGADRFVFSGERGADIIRDVEMGRDVLEFRATGFDTPADALAAAERQGKSTLIPLGDDASVLLRGIAKSTLTEDLFDIA